MGPCDGIIRIINCFSCPNAHVVTSAIGTASVLLANHSENTKLFKLANGLNALMQVEESWSGKVGVCAARAISNIIRGRVGGED